MMDYIENARRLRPIIERAVQSLPDNDALKTVMLYPVWRTDTVYASDYRVRYDGILYRCITGHTAQETWTPDVSPSLWSRVLVEDGKILPWVQPDSTNPYSKGDKVTHNGKTWVSEVDGNVWEPGVYGWTEYVEEV